MLENLKSTVDKGRAFGILLIDFSKAFDCLSHELIIAKLNAFGLSFCAETNAKLSLEYKELK